MNFVGKTAEIDPRLQAARERILFKVMTPGQQRREIKRREKVAAKEKAAKVAQRAELSERRKVARMERRLVTLQERRDSDPMFALQGRVRSLVSSAISRRGQKKSARTEEILGCTIAAFFAHIERQFLPGMSWENRRLWHIDHIVPMATAKTEADVLALNHFTNLRPMWAPDNLSKREKQTHLI